MSASFYQIRQCNNPSCGLRFPLVEGQMGRCPRCLDETVKIAEYPLAREPAKVVDAASHHGPLVLLDNIRSAWNVGAIFRTADGFGFSGLHLCGITPTPENEAVQKTSLGAENHLPWRYHPNALLAAQEFTRIGYTLFALELTDDAIPLPRVGKIPEKTALVLGGEVCGVDPEILSLCQRKLYIPMRGQKRSFNVAIAFAVAAYELTRS